MTDKRGEVDSEIMRKDGGDMRVWKPDYRERLTCGVGPFIRDDTRKGEYTGKQINSGLFSRQSLGILH